MLALTLLIAAWAAPPTYRVDASSHPGAHHAQPVAQAAGVRCGTGGDLDAAVAIVVVGRRPGASAWGHAALRFVTCEGGGVEDLLIEAYRFNRHTAADLPVRFPAARIPEGRSTLRRNRGRLFLRLEDDPAVGGDYSDELAANRDVWEAWLDLPPDDVRTLRADLLRRVDRQMGRLEAGTPLAEGRYRALRHNCMVPIAEAIAWQHGRPDEPPTVTFPFRALESVETEARSLVVYPSPGLWRALLDEEGRDQLGAGLMEERVTVPRDEPLVRRRLAPADAVWVANLAVRTQVTCAGGPPPSTVEQRDLTPASAECTTTP